MLQSPSSTPVANHSSIAIGIAGSIVTGDTAQKHVALIYRAEHSEPRLLHLAWHQKLIHEPWDGKYHWIEFSGVDVELQETFADWAVLVAGASHDPPIPYSVVFSPDKNFEVDGRFIDRKDGSGLTCATFLLALFADYGLPLVQTDTWPKSRAGDFKWVRKILHHLRRRVGLPHFMEQVRRRRELRRFRPEEVFATAGLFAGVPLRFDAVDPVARDLLTKLPN